MKLKIFVALGLFFSIFLAVSIFLISFLKMPMFIYLYFVFAFFWLIAIGASLKKVFPDEIKFSVLVIATILIAISLTFFGVSVKNYYDKDKAVIEGNLTLNSQIENLKITNDYYQSQIDFLNNEISKMKKSSLDLKLQIDELIAKQNAVIPTPTPKNDSQGDEEDD